jgi:hypothetical protein
MSELDLFYAALEKKADFKSVSSILCEFPGIDSSLIRNIELVSFMRKPKGSNRYQIEKQDDREKAENYLLERINHTSNNILKAQYTFLLSNFAPRYNDQAISEYRELLNTQVYNKSLSNSDMEYLLSQNLRVSLLRKDGVKSLVQALLNYISANNVSTEIKLVLLNYVIEHDELKPSRFTDATALYLDSINSETNEHKIKFLCRTGIRYCAILRAQDSKKYGSLERIFYERMADNEYRFIPDVDDSDENIMAAHLKQHILSNIMRWYDKAACKDKRNKAELEFVANKKFLKYPITYRFEWFKTDEQKAYFEKYLKDIELLLPMPFIFRLGLDCFYLLPNHEVIEQHKIKPIEGFDNSMVDINGNVILNTESSDEFTRTIQTYNIVSQLGLNCSVDMLLRRLHNKTIRYSDFIKFFKHTAFSCEITWPDSPTYTWYDVIRTPLKEFFKQFYNIVHNRPADLTLIIDVIPSKIELIIRDMLALTGHRYLNVTDKGEQRAMLLEELLKSDGFKEVFSTDDYLLFMFALTKNGLNLRNNVSHGMFKPYHYVQPKMINYCVILLICLLRLTLNPKFSGLNSTSADSQSAK